MNNIEQAITEQLEAMGVKYKVLHCGETKRDDWQCDSWRVTFRRVKQSAQLPDTAGMNSDYFTGFGHRKAKVALPEYLRKCSARSIARVHWDKENLKPVAPHAAGVLHSLLSDASAANESFNDWCSNYGFNPDSFKAFNTYQACCDIAKQLDTVFTRAEQSALSELLQDY